MTVVSEKSYETWIEKIRGERFGRLVVLCQLAMGRPIVYESKRWGPFYCLNRLVVLLQCDCGSRVSMKFEDVRSGGVWHCGDSRHRRGPLPGSKSQEHRIWRGMHSRCTYPNSKAWKYYGGRGIRVAPEWSTFAVFYDDMGKRPAG